MLGPALKAGCTSLGALNIAQNRIQRTDVKKLIEALVALQQLTQCVRPAEWCC